MELYKVNNDLGYEDSEYVKRNVFLKIPAECEELPKYEDIKDKLPMPIWEGHEDAIECYYYAWKTAFGNLKKAEEKSRFVSNYIDTAFNGFLFMWDSSFIVMFGKYGSKIFDFQKTLDNFYSHQHKDGYICREICEYEIGEHFTRHDPSGTGPNIMPWSEWESYLQTGDVERVSRIFDPLVAYHLWLKANHTWRDGTYWSTGWGCGMDNQPRLQAGYHQIFSHGHMVWADTCIQQILSAKILVEFAKILGREKEEAVKELKDEIAHLTSAVNDLLWNEEDGFYYDLYKDNTHNKVKSIGAFWALLADILPKENIGRFVDHLENENEFKRPHRVPSLSADHPEYNELGDYWKGSVWAPTNYMILKGLEKNGYNELAYDIACNNLENVVNVYNDTKTLWENYAPEVTERGCVAKSEFVGWSGLFPISVMLEYVFGIRPHARERKIVWYVNRTERHGVTRYPLGDISLDIVCEARSSSDEEPQIKITCPEKVTLELHYNGKVKTITN